MAMRQRTKSDIVVGAYGDYFYRIGRYNQDNLTKYSVTPPRQNGSFRSMKGRKRQPLSAGFVSNEKAYLLRYGSSKLWVINPSVAANDEAHFKIGD